MTPDMTSDPDPIKALESYLSFLIDHDMLDVFADEAINHRLDISRAKPVAKPPTLSLVPQVKSDLLRSDTLKDFSLTEALARAEAIALKLQTLDELYEALEAFSDMPLRYEGAKTLVKGRGEIRPHWLILGDAPGLDEDEQGLSFCGAQGRLLARIASSLGIDKTSYFSHSVFWRPAGNRPLTSEDLSLSAPFLKAMIRICQPKGLILLGASGAKALFSLNDGVQKLRQQALIYQQIPIVTTYPPAFLLKNPAAKTLAWHDLISFVTTTTHHN